MVQTCYICKWRADKLPRRSFHKFPYDEAEKQKWLDIIGKSDASLGKRTSVCSIHFEKSCFRYGLVNGRELLRQGSLPTIQLTRPPEVDPYEGLYTIMQQVNVDVKMEPHSPTADDWTVGIGAHANYDTDGQGDALCTDRGVVDSMNQEMATNNYDTYEITLNPITVEVPQNRKCTKYKPKAKSKQNGGKTVLMDISSRKEFLQKQSLIRMLVERLRRDHIKLKNYIQSLEERQKATKKRRRKHIEICIE